IVRAVAVAIVDGTYDQDHLGLARPTNLNFTIDQRGLFNTAPVDWSTAHITGGTIAVEDITIPVMLFQNLVARANYGIVKLKAVTYARKQPVQLGDLLSLNDRRGALPGYGNIDPVVKWEAVRKSPFLLDANPRIEWLLALALNPKAPARSDTAVV